MAICDTSCTTTVPSSGADLCKINTRKGGIERVIFLACDTTFLSITDLAEWQAKITADEIHATGRIKGQAPAGSATLTKLTSCDPEQVTGESQSITWMDFNFSSAGTEFTFYNTIKANPDGYIAAFLDCNDNLYFSIDRFSLEAYNVIAEDNKEVNAWNCTLTYEGSMPTPQNIAGLGAVLA